jgi:hypothetical protein
MGFPPRMLVIATAASTTPQVVRNFMIACMEMRLRPARPRPARLRPARLRPRLRPTRLRPRLRPARRAGPTADTAANPHGLNVVGRNTDHGRNRQPSREKNLNPADRSHEVCVHFIG